MSIQRLSNIKRNLLQLYDEKLAWHTRKQHGSARYYFLATALLAFALWLRLTIAPISAGLQYLTFFPAVALTAVIGGLLPGLYAAVLGIFLATYVFPPPYYAITLASLKESAWSNIVFLMDGFIVSFSIDRMHKFREKYAQELQETIEAKDAVQKINQETQALLQRNQILLKNSMEGVHVMDGDGNIIEVNDAFCEALGYSRDELLGMNVRDIDVQIPNAELRERLQWVIDKSMRFETEHRRKDGSIMQVEIACCGARLNELVFVYAASRDITERKKSEAVLQRYKLVIDTALDGFWLTDINGKLLEANEAYAQMTGYSIDELVGMHISQLEAIEKPEDVAAHIQELSAKGYVRFETRHRCKDGHLLDIEVAARSAPDSGHLFVFCRDISERKKREEELRVAAVSFETHEAILITDANANIVRVNRAFTDITGYEAEEVLGKNPGVMSSGRQDKAFYVQMWQQLLHTGSWAGEIWDKRKNGHIYPKWLTISAVRNEQHETINYVGIFSDITLRKQAEDEMRNLAFYDALTQLPNRRLFMDRFNSTLKISARNNDYGALLFIDLDRFKILNDTLGHDFGDLLLIEVANRIKFCVREVDTVARLGGDEFVVLLQGINQELEAAKHTAGTIAEKIRESLAQPYRLRSHIHHSSPSIGISLYRGYEKSVEEVIHEADQAMYLVKNAGRNATRFFEPGVAA